MSAGISHKQEGSHRSTFQLWSCSQDDNAAGMPSRNILGGEKAVAERVLLYVDACEEMMRLCAPLSNLLPKDLWGPFKLTSSPNQSGVEWFLLVGHHSIVHCSLLISKVMAVVWPLLWYSFLRQTLQMQSKLWNLISKQNPRIFKMSVSFDRWSQINSQWNPAHE